MVTLDTDSMTTLHWIGVALAAVSGIVHLVLGVRFLPGAFGISFLVATVGFAAGIAAILLNYRRRLFYAVGIPFTAGQVVIFAWTVVQGINELGAIAIVDKVAQIGFIVVLVLLLQRD
ncbi:hypothetical protein C2R22_19875 [Salinigranum rubrum]|uniref:Uncharacterized protein n=1 Tax=Salinigranum rubrum TaxID=755307 RepID=A0A2I8VNY0_9EURY|nr:hypothetical protein [Salinigranum rubrum]AUV83623.1 hypothetical protein C2R22_19875 [Salinigranum rubrum]